MMEKIKFLIIDVDGTLTDGKIYLDGEKEIFKVFNIKDGLGIKDLAIAKGITPIIITGRSSKIVLQRCKELGISNIYQGIKEKSKIIKEIITDLSSAAYIGDDLNDYESMKMIKKNGGLIGCPNDAAKEVQKISNYVSRKKGGEGAVRDFIEWLIDNKYVGD